MARAQGQKGKRRVQWSPHEDKTLVEYIETHGEPKSWKYFPACAGLSRSGKSCRLRWKSYLKPDINKKPFTEEEEVIIIKLRQQLGKK